MHAATDTGELACGTKPHKEAPLTETRPTSPRRPAARAGPSSRSTKKRIRDSKH